MSKTFSPSTPLERAVYAGKYEAVVELLRSSTPHERKALRTHALAMEKLIQKARWSTRDKTFGGWGQESTFDQLRAVSAAIVVCGSTREVAQHYYDGENLVALIAEFRPPSLEGLADAMLAFSSHRIRDVQRLIIAGLVPRPTSDDYALGLIALPGTLRHKPPEDIHDVIAADSGLQDVLLRIMEVEGTSELSLAGVEKYTGSWSQILRTMCAQGIYSRALLLDKTLAALENDWPQFRSSWFSQFHEQLEPSIAELTVNVQRYLALCGSRIPPTVTMALGVLKQLDAAGALDSGKLLEALRPALSSSVKSHVEAALKMLDQVVTREPSRTAEAASLIAPALVHASADVQKQVLRRIADWGADDGLRQTLRELLAMVAAVNRKPLEQIINGGSPAKAIASRTSKTAAASRAATPPTASSTASPASPLATPPPAPAKRISPLDPSRKLAAITGIDELVECVAYVFENPTDVDELERALGALVQAAPLNDDARTRFGPLVKRFPKRATKPIARELARLLAFVLLGERTTSQSTVDHGGHGALAQQYLISRVDDLMDIAARGKHQAPLSAATHQRGFIDPALFVERVAAHQKHDVRSSQSEQVLALLRLTPAGITKQALARARVLADEPFTRALRYAMGDDIKPGKQEALFAAAARIRHPGADDTALAKHVGDLGPDAARVARYAWRVTSDSHKVQGKTYVHHRFELTTDEVPKRTPSELLAVMRHPPGEAKKRPWYSRWTFAGIDEGTILYAATLLPSSPEAFFAEGARVIGNNLDWWEAEWQNRAYLNLLLEPTTDMTPMATLLLALGLGGKEAGQTAIAVDAFVHSYKEGRLDLPALGRTLRDLLSTLLVKSARYAKSLAAALRIDGGMAVPLFDLLCTAIEATPDDPPRDTAMLLELLQEVMLTSERPLPAQARKALESLKLGGKGRALQKRLLE